MTAALAVARERIVRPREHLIASRLGRFAWRHREAVAALTRRHPRLADLALSFPALLFALAVPRRRFDPEPVIERTIAGAPLSELAAGAAIPMWTRKLMPEAFLYSVPLLPDGEMFRRQIANYLPASPKDANSWLEAVSHAFVWADDGVALWVARHHADPIQRRVLRDWRVLCLWAWHSGHPDAAASRYISTRWSADILPMNAMQAARQWTASTLSLARMGQMTITDAWAEPATVDGYLFEPVRDHAGLVAQATAFSNCARLYAEDITAGASRLWTMSRDGAPVAMVELHISSADPHPKLGEVSGPSGKAIGAEASAAAHRWYRMHVPMRALPEPDYLEIRAEAWRWLWRSYWLDRKVIPEWLPMQYEWQTWNRLNDVDWKHRRSRRRRWRR